MRSNPAVERTAKKLRFLVPSALRAPAALTSTLDPKIMEPPAKVVDFLPGAQAKWAAWLSAILSGLLYALLEWLQVDKLYRQS